MKDWKALLRRSGACGSRYRLYSKHKTLGAALRALKREALAGASERAWDDIAWLLEVGYGYGYGWRSHVFACAPSYEYCDHRHRKAQMVRYRNRLVRSLTVAKVMRLLAAKAA